MLKRYLCLFLSLVLVLSVLPPVPVAAEISSEEIVDIYLPPTTAPTEAEVVIRPIIRPSETTEPSEEPEPSEETEPSEEPELPGLWEENGDYYFRSFQDLKTLCAMTVSGYPDVYYVGDGPLTISEDLTLLDGAMFNLDDNTVILAPGVTLLAPENHSSFYAGTLIVNGTISAGNRLYLCAWNSLEVNGRIESNGTIRLGSNAAVTGIENIQLGADGQIRKEISCYSCADFAAAVREGAGDLSGVFYDVYWTAWESLVLDTSVSVPDHVRVHINAEGLTIAPGAVLELERNAYVVITSDVTIQGALVNNGQYLDIYGRLSAAGNYSGSGVLGINAENTGDTLEALVTGLDLTAFSVEELQDYDGIPYWNLTPNGGTPEQDPSKLNAPTDVSWDATGRLYWEHSDDRRGILMFRYYKDGASEPAFSTGHWVDSGRSGSSYELVYLIRESGSYHVTVQYVPWEEDEGTWQPSDAVASDVFVYQRPETTYPAPQELSWDTWPSFSWSRPEGHTGQFELSFLYAPNATARPEPINAWPEVSGTSYTVPDWILDQYGDGCYYFQVRTLTEDITVCNSGAWSALSPAYLLGDVTEEGLLAYGSVGQVQWELTESGLLRFSGTGGTGDYAPCGALWYAFREQIRSIVLEEGITRIGDYAFYDLPNVTAVDMPRSLTQLGIYSFGCCDGLKQVQLPAGITSVGGNPFPNCQRLETITVEDGASCLKVVDNVLFWCVDGQLTTLLCFPCGMDRGTYTVPQGVEVLGCGAFSHQSFLQEVILPGSLTYISEAAFECSALCSITLPASVHSVQFGAFRDCTKLNTVRFLGDAPEIRSDAFENVQAQVYYPSANGSWTTAYRQNYGGSLSWRTDRDNGTDLAGGTSGCLSWRITMEGVLVLSGDGYTGTYSDADPAPWHAYRSYFSSIVLEEGVTAIGAYAFRDLPWVETVSLPSTLEDIGNYAFLGCESLETVTIPALVYSTGINPFACCTSLVSIQVEQGSQFYESREGVLFYKNEEDGEYLLCSYPSGLSESRYTVPEGTTGIFLAAFLGDVDLTGVELPASLKEIYDLAFAGTNLEKISIPGKVTYIGPEAFASSALETVSFQGDPPSIGSNAFFGVTAQVLYPMDNEKWTGSIFQNYGGELTWKLRQTDIADGVCGEVRWRITEDGVLVLFGSGATENFWESYAPWHDYYADIVAIEVQEGVTGIGAYAFQDLEFVETVSLPDTLTDILAYAFWDCDSLEQISLPASLTNTGYNPFAAADNLTRIQVDKDNPVYYTVDDVLFYCNPQYGNVLLCTYPEGKEDTVYTIPEGTMNIFGAAFFRNETLQEVILPESLITITGSAFAYSYLETITFPKNLQQIGDAAFEGCELLDNLTFRGKPGTIAEYAFANVVAEVWYQEKDWTVEEMLQFGGQLTWVPIQTDGVDSGILGDVHWKLTQEGTLVLYGSGSTDDYWEAYPDFYQYADQITAIEVQGGVTGLGAYLFYNMDAVQTVSLPDSLTYIGALAFLECDSIRQITVPASVEDMDMNPFAGMQSLQSIIVEQGSGSFRTVDGVLFRGDSLVAYPSGKTAGSYSLPGGTVSVGPAAFFDNVHLNTVSLPEGLEEIQRNAFELTALTSITIPAEVVLVDSYAFANNANLQQITFLGEPPYIDGNAFTGVSAVCHYPGVTLGWTQDILLDYGGSLTWTGDGDQEDLVDWGTTGDVKWKLTEQGTLVLFGEGYTDDYRETYPDFYAYVDRITAIVVEEGVTELGQYLFYDMDNVRTVSLPDSLVYIADAVFLNCDGVEQIHIPANVADMGANPFSSMSSLMEITVDPGNRSFSVQGNALFRQGGVLVSYPGGRSETRISLPDTTTAIGDAAFYGNTVLETVTLNEGLREIGYYAFEYSDIREICLPKSLESIEELAFGECYSLDTVTFLGEAPYIAGAAFRETDAVAYYPAGSESWLEEGVRQSYGGSLTWQERKQELASGSVGELSWQLTSDGQLRLFGQGTTGSFSDTDVPWIDYVDRITSVYVEDGVTELGDFSLSLLEQVQQIRLPETLVSLGAATFLGCTSLETITLPASLERIGYYMFADCSDLRQILVAEGNPVYYSRDGVLFARLQDESDLVRGLCAYPEGRPGTSYTVPEDVDAIVDAAFGYNSQVTQVILPQNLYYIGNVAFRNSAIQTVQLPEQMSYIGVGAFYECQDLTQITIPAGVMVIDAQAFQGSGLETVEFLGAAPVIGENAFADVYADVSYPASEETWTADKLQDYGGGLNWIPVTQDIASGKTGTVSWRITQEGILILSGQGETDDYEPEQTPWADYAGQITAIEVQPGITVLGEYLFSGLSLVQQVQLPETLTDIGLEAFGGCRSLTSITLPASLERFGGLIFDGCTSLQEILVDRGNALFYSRDGILFLGENEDIALCIYPLGKPGSSYTLPSDTTHVLTGAFMYNDTLREVILPEGVVSVGAYAFAGSRVEKVTLPESLGTLSANSFRSCAGLTEIVIPAGVQSIGEEAFRDSGLKTVRFLGDAPTISGNAFANVTADVYCPVGNETWTADKLLSYGGSLNWIGSGSIEIYGDNQVLGGKSLKLTGCRKPYGGKLLWHLAEGNEEFATLKVKGDTVTVTAADVTELQQITLTAVSEDGSVSADFPITIIPKVKALKIYQVILDDNGAEQLTDMSQGEWWFYELHDGNRDGFTMQLRAELLPEGAVGQVTWSSSNKKVATVDQSGTVYFTGKTGSTVLTATADNGVKASFTQKVIDPVTNVAAVGETEVRLMGGKSQTLKIKNADTGKNITGKNVQWSLWMEDGDASAFASINSSGKLTTKKVVEEVSFFAVADVLTDGVYTSYVVYQVTLYPATSHVELTCEEETVNGTTLYFNLNTRTKMNIFGNVLPEDAMPAELVWTTTDTKGSYASIGLAEDGSVEIYDATGKTGTITITAKAQDGSKKTASVKIQFGRYAEGVEISLPDTVLVSGSSMTLAAQAVPDNVSKKGVVWSLADPADKAYVTLSGSKLTAKKVYDRKTVTLIATSKDGKASASAQVTILPKDQGMLTVRNALTLENVTKSTVLVDLNETNREVYLEAVNFYDGSLAYADWSYKAGSNAQIYERDGKLVVRMLKAGSVNITAKSAGRTATVTVKAVKLTDSVSITTKKGTNLVQDASGRLMVQVASGKSVDLKAVLSGGSSSRVTWSIVSGSSYAKLSTSGKLTAAKNVLSTREVVVRATAADGSGAYGQITVLVKPLATGIKIYTLEADAQRQTLSLYSGNGSVTRSNTSLVWDMEADSSFRIYANVYPWYTNAQWRSAMQEVTWKSSSAKVAAIDENGVVTCLKPGTTTITATAADGSGQKISFKLTVVKRATDLILPEGHVVGGKSISLKPIFEPADVTNKKLHWEISGDTAFAKIDQKGKLTTKKVTQVKTVTVTASTLDGSELCAQCQVTIWPKAAKSVTLVAEGYQVSGSTLILRQGESLHLEALVDPGNACPLVTWKSADESYVTVEDGTVKAVKPGKAVTVTCTAADGSGKKTTVKVKTVW